MQPSQRRNIVVNATLVSLRWSFLGYRELFARKVGTNRVEEVGGPGSRTLCGKTVGVGESSLLQEVSPTLITRAPFPTDKLKDTARHWTRN